MYRLDDDTAIGAVIRPLLLSTIMLSADVSAVSVLDIVPSVFDMVVMLGVAFDSAKTDVVRVVSCVACEVIALDWLAMRAFRLLNEMIGDIYYKSINILDRSSFN